MRPQLQREARPGKREDKPAAEVGKMEALKHGLEDEPFAGEAGCRGHRRETHGCKQSSNAEQPVASRAAGP